MKTLQVELPDQMAKEVERAVETGVFLNATEVVRVALANSSLAVVLK